MKDNTSIIYRVTNLVNNKVYIGFTFKEEKRYEQHLQHARLASSKNHNCVFYKAIRKYGENNFKYEEIYTGFDKEHTLNVMETYFITEYRSFIGFEDCNGYNMTLGGEGVLGYTHNEERIKKMSDAKKYGNCHLRGVRPWNTTSVKSKNIEYWLIIDVLYPYWKETNCSDTHLGSHFGFKITSNAIVNMFRDGWIPNEDKDWLEYINIPENAKRRQEMIDAGFTPLPEKQYCPWAYSNITPELLYKWAIVNEMYDEWLVDKCGDKLLARRLNISSRLNNFVDTFVEGYNPYEDEDWLEWIATQDIPKLKQWAIDNKLVGTNNYKVIKPWMNPGIKDKSVWIDADYYYKQWILHDKCGHKRLRTSISSPTILKTIVEHFVNNWIPSEDQEWLEWKDNYSNTYAKLPQSNIFL